MLNAERPNVVHIITPPETHAELTKLALMHDAHVYVEKPFALNVDEAREVLDLAESRGLKVCAAHQVLFQDAGRRYREYLRLLGQPVHVESYFSFKTVRRAGSGLMAPVDQLVDILPHPVYLMLSAFQSNGDTDIRQDWEMRSLEVDPEGEVRAVFRFGSAFALLIVSLRARPIESYLRIAGTNGSIVADFVLAGVTKLLGPGSSAIAAVLKPFSEARQVVFGTLGTLFKLVFRRQKSYAGLGELIDAFYRSISGEAPPPITRSEILNTVSICAEIEKQLRQSDDIAEKAALARLTEAERTLIPPPKERGLVLVTGGTGFLGKAVISELRRNGWSVRVLARRLPSARNRIPGIEYVQADIAEELPEAAFQDVEVIAHLAAETAGGKPEHERNTVNATRNVAEAAVRHGVKRFINVSSIAVLKPSTHTGGPLREDSPVDFDNLARGPYVWAKAEAEKILTEKCGADGIDVRTIRLGPLVDYRSFSPPGRLGRELGTLFVAVGPRKGALSVCDVQTAAEVLRYYIAEPDTTPEVLNLVEAPPPTREELVVRLRESRPELRIMWLPSPVLKVLSVSVKGGLRVIRPSSKPLDLHAAFASESYDTATAARVIDRAQRTADEQTAQGAAESKTVG
jgi:nucleoside-diphosphate-sugar epimerase/predicted dehydrogenase